MIEPAQAVRLVVVARENHKHARHGLGRGGFYRLDPGMGMRRAHEGGMDLAGEREIVGEAPRARQETPILDPPHRLADERGHGFLPALSLTSRGRCRC